MSDKPREKFSPKTPPKGVAAQISGPVREAHDLTPVDNQVIRPRAESVAGESIVDGIDRRTRETKNMSIEAVKTGQTTLDRVEDLRKETKLDIGAIHTKIEATNTKLDGVITVVGAMQGVVGKTVGQNEQIISMLDEQRLQRQNTETVTTVTRIAEVEVDKTRQLSQIEIERSEQTALIDHQKAKRALRLELVKTVSLKLIVGIAALIGVFMAGRCDG